MIFGRRNAILVF